VMNFRITSMETSMEIFSPEPSVVALSLNGETVDHCDCDVRRESLCSVSTAMFGLCLRADLKQHNSVLVQLIRLMDKIEFAQSLYPTQKSLAKDHPLYASEEFQARLGTISLWLNITRDLSQKLKQMMDVMQIDRWENTPWACIDMEYLKEILQNSRNMSSSSLHDDISLPESCEMSGEEEDEVDGDEESCDVSEMDSLRLSVGESENTTAARIRRKSVRFEDDADQSQTVASSDSCESLANSRPTHLSTVSSVEIVSVTSVYRHYVDHMLKKIGMRKLRSRLKDLLDGTLQRAKHALCKEPPYDSGMPEVRS
jgi:hypothetical protein